MPHLPPVLYSLGSIDILTVLSLPAHEDVLFLSFMSLTALSSVLKYRSCISFVKSIPKYFYAIENGDF